MSRFLGIDTSNYTTSVAIFDDESGEIIHCKKLLPVKAGSIGLKQSDAVFSHIKQLPELVSSLMQEVGPSSIDAIGVSVRPRDVELSLIHI